MTNFLDQTADFANQVNPHLTAPNPRVGCLIVKQGKVIAQGVHEKFGGNHAEINTLKDFDKDLTGCEIYITLEPCDSFQGKKTQSCTDFLIKKLSKFQDVKIFIGALDPKFNGKNIEKINRAGIFCEYEKNKKCDALNPFLENWNKQATPFLKLKMACSLDGKITGKKWISNKSSRKLVHQSRAKFFAILTTTETISQDDPRLNVRLKKTSEKISNPQLLVFGKREISSTAQIFQIKNRQIHFFTGENLQEDFLKIKKLNIDSILTECGARMTTALLQAKLVNELEIFITPQIFGVGKNIFRAEFNLSENFDLKNSENLDGDLCLRFVRKEGL